MYRTHGVHVCMSMCVHHNIAHKYTHTVHCTQVHSYGTLHTSTHIPCTPHAHCTPPTTEPASGELLFTIVTTCIWPFMHSVDFQFSRTIIWYLGTKSSLSRKWSFLWNFKGFVFYDMLHFKMLFGYFEINIPMLVYVRNKNSVQFHY